MSVINQQVYAAPGVFYPGVGGGGGGGGSFSTINVSTIDIQPNGDINWDGSVNFQGTNGGYVSLLSTFAGLSPANGISITGAAGNESSTINLYIGASGQANLQVLTPSAGLTMPGVQLFGLSSVNTSSINGSAYPPTTQTGVSAVTPLNSGLTYVKGGQTATLFSLNNQIAQHSYRLEFPAKIQGWNATDGLTNTYAPQATDWIDFYPLGNVAGNPTPVATTLSMPMISSMNNDWEGTITCVWKTTANGAQGFVANTSPSVAYSTSVEIGAFGYLTDLGQI